MIKKFIDPRRAALSLADRLAKKTVGFKPLNVFQTKLENGLIAPLAEEIPVAGNMLRLASRFFIPGDYSPEDEAKASLWMQQLIQRLKTPEDVLTASNEFDHEELNALDQTVEWITAKGDAFKKLVIELLDRKP